MGCNHIFIFIFMHLKVMVMHGFNTTLCRAHLGLLGYGFLCHLRPGAGNNKDLATVGGVHSALRRSFLYVTLCAYSVYFCSLSLFCMSSVGVFLFVIMCAL